jgi:hypothetical protein
MGRAPILPVVRRGQYSSRIFWWYGAIDGMVLLTYLGNQLGFSSQFPFQKDMEFGRKGKHCFCIPRKMDLFALTRGCHGADPSWSASAIYLCAVPDVTQAPQNTESTFLQLRWYHDK